MPAAPILCLGAQWRASDVYWSVAAKNGQLRGVNSRRLTSYDANFALQTGIYILFADYKPVYVGQANGSLFSRLQMHYRNDDLAGRWETFTWLGMRKVLKGFDPKLSNNASKFSINRKQLLDHLEAAMIHAFEPPMNGQEGRFGKAVIRYKQVRDPRLGPSDRGLLESVASKGGFVPNGLKITKSGWKDV
jgi:hypothetical protein